VIGQPTPLEEGYRTVVDIRRAVPEDAASIAAVHVNSRQVAYRGAMHDDSLDGASVTQRKRFWEQALAVMSASVGRSSQSRVTRSFDSDHSPRPVATMTWRAR
jgi:hypothetical protein